jgi:hypothetical protein
MVDHGGVLDDRIVPAGEVTKNDIVLDEIKILGQIKKNDNIRILKNGVQIVNTLNQLVSKYDYRVVYHSSNVAEDQLKIHNDLVRGAKEKGLVFPPVIAAAAPDRKLTEEPPENPKKGTLEKTDIPFLSYAFTKSKDGKSCVRAALASFLGISESKDERQQHIVFDDAPSVIKKAKDEGYRAYKIGDDGTTLDVALNEILQEELRSKLLQECESILHTLMFEPPLPRRNLSGFHQSIRFFISSIRENKDCDLRASGLWRHCMAMKGHLGLKSLDKEDPEYTGKIQFNAILDKIIGIIEPYIPIPKKPPFFMPSPSKLSWGSLFATITIVAIILVGPGGWTTAGLAVFGGAISFAGGWALGHKMMNASTLSDKEKKETSSPIGGTTSGTFGSLGIQQLPRYQEVETKSDTPTTNPAPKEPDTSNGRGLSETTPQHGPNPAKKS